MPCAIFRSLGLPALALLGLTQAVPAQKPTVPAKDGFFTKDATINYAVNGIASVGYAQASDVDAKKNPTSPTVRFDKGSSVARGLMVLNSSRVTTDGARIGQDLYAFNSSTLNFSSGSIGGSVLASDNSTVNVTGGSIANGLFASDSSTINLRGGSVTTGLVAEKRGIINISGGHLGKKIIVDDSGALNFSGVGLTKTLTEPEAQFDDKSYSLYTLFGKLHDGTSVNGKLVLVLNKSAAKLTLINVPAAPNSAPPVRPSGK